MVFIFLTIAINFLIIGWMPKKLTPQEIYVTWGMISAIAINSDLLLGNLLDWYDFGRNDLQLYDLIVDAVLPSSFAILFLNFMPVHCSKSSLRYIIIWTAFSVAYEWVAVWVGFENLKGWTPWYSTPIYFAVFLFLRWHIGFIRRSTK